MSVCQVSLLFISIYATSYDKHIDVSCSQVVKLILSLVSCEDIIKSEFCKPTVTTDTAE
jgi:hypothetical protein